MKKVTAYVCPKGNLERDPIRAFAWKLSEMSNNHSTSSIGNTKEVIDFSEALWIIENRDKVSALFAELEQEIDNDLV